MKHIILVLLDLIKFLNRILFNLQSFLICRYLDDSALDNPVSEKYRKFQIDAMPVIEKRELLDYKKLLKDYLAKHGKVLKPVNRRSKHLPPVGIVCPFCQAPYEYIFDNSGGRGQLGCKVCGSTFYPHNTYLDKVVFRCPHCNKTLSKVKDRKQFFIYKCVNDNCPFYLSNLRSMSAAEQADFKKHPFKYKVRFIFRAYDLDFKSLKEDPLVPANIDLARIRNAQHVLGLALTYHINYGLSSRQTAAILWDVHRIKLSHQTVANYAASAARIVKPFTDDYPYALSEQVAICGDETYVKVRGKKHYVFFIMDTVKKIITSYSVFSLRDGVSAIKAIFSTLSKFRKIPENLLMIFDGNPIYILAQHFFAQHGIYFDVKQVIGLTNDDPVSKEFRPLKQMIERLNRTFKSVYKAKNGFNALDKANCFMALFAAFFNFLRRNSALHYNVPVSIPEVQKMPDMPSKWLKLLQLSYEHLEKIQLSA